MIPGARAERGWLQRHRILPRKRLGQNFLVQPDVASRLVASMEITSGAEAVEIGAGAGALTRALLDAGARVRAIEIDPRLVALLRERFADPIDEGRLRIVPGSALEMDPASSAEGPGGRSFLAGNLPYGITTPLLLWAIEHRRSFSGGAVLVQREFAERIAASPGSRTYGSITVWLAYHATVRRITTVEPGAFWPVPKVESALISIRFHETPPVDLDDPTLLERTLSACFGQRRKMLRSSLAAAVGGTANAARVLAEAGVDPTRRAETLTLGEFAAIARAASGVLR